MSKRHRKKLPTESVVTEITSLSHEGRGIATVNQRTTFISNALPNEKVEFIYTKLNNRYAEGKAIDILNANPQRVQPACDYFGVCGGCSLQHMSTEQQLSIKQQTLQEQLQHFATTLPKQWLTPLTGPEFHYRHKARLGVRYVIKKDSVLVGFREQQSRYLANIWHCKTLAEPVASLIAPLRETLMQLKAKQDIAQIEVAIGDEKTTLVIRNLVELDANDCQQLIEFGKNNSVSIVLQPNKPQPLQKLYPNDDDLYLFYRLPEYHLTFWFHPFDFTQINPAINRAMVSLALKHLDIQSTDKVLDLFCGLGNFTLPISKFAKSVVGIEGSEDMVARAKMNASRNNIFNAEFFAADLTQTIQAEWMQQKYDKLLLDPARSGAAEILEHIPLWYPERIVYVSCNPATLARDIGIIVKYGYQLEKAGIINMFPQTNHVESIAVLSRK